MIGINKRKIQWAISLFLVLYCFVLSAQAQYGGGTGEPNDPYLIYTAEQMNTISAEPNDWGKHFKLMVDIDLSGFDGAQGRPTFNIIGMSYGNAFTGVFDGNGHTISDLMITGGYHLGLFGYLASGAEVKNVGVVDVNITGSGYYVGGLVGRNYGHVTQCYTSGAVSGSGLDVGGLVGRNNGDVTLCYSTGTVSGNNFVGGLVGRNYGHVTHCYSTGAVSGNWCIGGLVGSNSGDVTRCYSTSAVSGNGRVGGLVGWGAAATQCFWDIQISGQAASVGSTGLTTAQMQDAQTYLDTGWDWVGEIENGTSEIWQMPRTGGYPVLAILSGYTPPKLQGAGTPEDPYLISDALGLGAMVHYSSYAHYRLATSIDLAGIRWGTAVIPSFAGTFDGNGLTISQLRIEGRGYMGLFGRLTSGAEVKDLGIVEVNITSSGSFVGGLMGENDGGYVTRCYSTGTVSGSNRVGGLVGSSAGSITTSYNTVVVSGSGVNIGGLVGFNDRGHVNACYNTGTVSGNERIGGLVGFNDRGHVNACYNTNTSTVIGNECIGGLVGFNDRGHVNTCYNTGMVRGNERIGGLVGKNEGYVTRCYSTGAVRGTGQYGSAGGLVGSGDPERVKNSVWDVETSGLTFSAAGVGLTTAEMMDPEILGLQGLGGDPNWILDSGRDYPRLVWEGTPGQIIPEPVVDWLDGIGTPKDPFQIENADQLLLLHKSSLLWNKHFVLKADIDLDPNRTGRRVFVQAVIPIFEGSFVGNGHVIRNLHIEGRHNLGFFRQLTEGSVVRDLGLENVSVHGVGSNVGGLVGANGGGYVINCYSTGVVTGDSSIGGLVGSNSGTVIHCYSTSSIGGIYSVGGLVGSNGGDIIRCYNTGAVSGENVVGGLVGGNHGGSVLNCYSTSPANGKYSVGGLVGSNSSNVSHCYSTGVTNGDEDVGGLVGSGNPDRVINSFWDIQTSGQATSTGGKELATAEMQTAGTFLNAGWDFVEEIENGTEDIWWILEGQDYPRLVREFSAFSPEPQDSATGVTLPIILRWRLGASAIYHDVYFDENADSVANATTSSLGIYRGRLPVEITTYDLNTLELDKTYHWRIDEVNEADPNSPWKGNVWSFTTANFLIVDDFESYNDLELGNRIFETWIDGYDDPTNGSVVDYDIPPYVEITIAHSGRESMSFLYDNSGSANYSEATMTLTYPRDWTEEGVGVLSLWFGDLWPLSNNTPESMYVALANATGPTAVVYHDNPDATIIKTWTEWTINLQEFADQGVNLNDVDTISIGFGDKNNPQAGGSGYMYFDDIRLYRPRPEPEPEPEPAP